MFDNLDFEDVPVMRGQSVFIPKGWAYIRLHPGREGDSKKQDEYRLVMSNEDWPESWERAGIAVAGGVLRLKEGRALKVVRNAQSSVVSITSAVKNTTLRDHVKGDKFVPIHVGDDAVFADFTKITENPE